MNSNILFLFWQKKDWNDLEKAKIEFVYFMVTGRVELFMLRWIKQWQSFCNQFPIFVQIKNIKNCFYSSSPSSHNEQ